MQEDIKRFDTQLAQQVMQNVNQQSGIPNRFNRGGPGRGRGRGRSSFRGQPFQQHQTFRPRGNFHPQRGQYFNPGNGDDWLSTDLSRSETVDESFLLSVIDGLNLGQYQHSGNYQARPPRPYYNNNNNNNMNPFQGQPNFHLPTSYRPRKYSVYSNPSRLLYLENNPFVNGNNKRPYPPNNNNYYNPRQSWPNKRPRFDGPPSYQQGPPSNRVDYRYVANQNTYQQQQQFYWCVA